jgi:IS1 family transposase
VTTIVHRRTRCIVAHDVLEERTHQTMQPLVDATFEQVPKVHTFHSDGLVTYKDLVYRAGKKMALHRPVEDKSQTYSVESVNADLRCYVPSLDRRGRCFPRSLTNLKALLRLFVTCYNRCALARLKSPKRRFAPSDFLPILF